MRLIDADKLKEHIDKLPALPDGNFAGNHSALKALINMQPTIEQPTNCSEFPNNSDTISRQEAIDAIDKRFDDIPMRQTKEILMLRRDLRKLPSAQPVRKKGEWIDRSVFDEPQGKRIEQWQSAKCSVCGKYHTTPYLYNYTHYDFCPSCGAKMER